MAHEFAEVSHTVSDKLRDFAARRNNGPPWAFQNTTPYETRLYYQPPGSAQAPSEALALLKGHEQRTLSADSAGRTLSAGGIVTADFLPVLGKPYVLDPQHKLVLLGSVVYDIFGHGGNYYNLYADLAGVHFVNHFPFDVDIHYQGNLVAIVGAYDGLGFYSNSRATIYYDNTRDGLRLGDVFFLYKRSAEFLYAIKIDDVQTKNIHIGVTAPVDP